MLNFVMFGVIIGLRGKRPYQFRLALILAVWDLSLTVAVIIRPKACVVQKMYSKKF